MTATTTVAGEATATLAWSARDRWAGIRPALARCTASVPVSTLDDVILGGPEQALLSSLLHTPGGHDREDVQFVQRRTTDIGLFYYAV